MRKLTEGRLLARNTAFNLLGQGLPMLVALLAIPPLVHGLGTERFGVLALAWMLIGYFSLFDFGLGRALTQLIAERLGAGREHEVLPLARTGVVTMVVLGMIGAVVLWALTPWIVHRALRVPGDLVDQTRSAFQLLALSLPFVVGTAGLRGVLEAQQRFGWVNAIRVPLGMLTFLGPLAVLPFSVHLPHVIAALVAARVVACAAHVVLCARVLPDWWQRPVLDFGLVRSLMGFGGWMTVTNLVSPLMTYLDRFLIASLLSVSAVAFYVTPYEVVTKFWVIPMAILGVLFPAIAASFRSDPARSVVLFERTSKVILVAMFPIVLVAVTFASDGLHVWLGGEFAEQGTRVLQWLAVGVFINSIAQVPFTLVQASGRPDLTAKLHLVELPVYLGAVWWMIDRFGIEGAAIAWAARVAADLLVLMAMTHRLLPAGSAAARRVLIASGAALFVLGLGSVPQTLLAKSLFVVVATVCSGYAAWSMLLSADERQLLLARRAGVGEKIAPAA